MAQRLSRVVVTHDGRIDSSLGSTASSHSSVLSSKGFLATAGTAACTNSHNMSVVYYINHQGGVRSKALYKHGANLLLWTDRHFLSIRLAHVPSLLNRRADMRSKKGIPLRKRKLHLESVQMNWTLYGTAKVDLFATSCMRFL